MTDEEIKALQDENATLKKQLEETQKIVSDMQAKAAEDSVEAACAEGKIWPLMMPLKTLLHEQRFSRSTGKNCFLRSTNSPENSLTHYI